MPESGRTDPFSDVISLVAGPIAAVIRSFDQLRRGSEELLKGLENFNRTMESLNETAERINRMLNDFEEPVRAMIPQLTRTIKMADDLSTRLSTPVDQVIPGLNRLAETLNNPVFRTLPRDLGRFGEVLEELTRRMSPLTQIAEQAGGLFGLRIPGLSPRPAAAPPRAPADEAPPVGVPEAAPAARPAKKTAAKKRAPAEKRAPAKAPAKKKAAARRSA